MLKFGYALGFLCLSVFGPALAQEGTDANPVKNSKISKSELKETGYWGIYEELPFNQLQKSDIWLRSDPKTLELSFLRLKASNKFLPLLRLSQSIIFTGGLAPPKAYPKLSEARFFAALELGELRSANKLVSSFDLEKAGDEFLIKYIDNLFYELRNDEACSLVEATKPSKPNKRILEMRAACYALNNEKSAALLNIDLANQIGPSSNIWLNNSILYLSAIKSETEPTTPIEFNGENGVNFALSNASKIEPIDEKFSRTSFRAANAEVLKKKSLPFNQAIAGAAFGAIDAFEIPDANLPPVKIENTSEIEPVPLPAPTFEEIAAHTLRKAGDISEFYVLSNKHKNSFNQIKIISIDDASMFAAAAILTGATGEVERLLKYSAENLSLQFALQIANGIERIDAKTRLANLEPSSREYFKAFGELLIASKIGIEIENFSTIETIIPISNDGQNQLLLAMEDAAKNNARAQTALLAHLATQNLRPSTIDPLSLSRIIGALKTVGFDKEARDLAIYCLIAQNISFSLPKPIAPPPPIGKPKTEDAKLKQKDKLPQANKAKSEPLNDKKPVQIAPQTPKPTNKSAPVKPAPSKPAPSKEKPKSEVPDWRKSID